MSEILASIAGTDITKYIIKDTYDVNTEPVYESWEDANFHEHRVYVRDRVIGSFDVVFFGSNNVPYKNFLTLLAGATTNNILTITLFVVNESQSAEYEVYCTITGQQHAETTDGRIVNKMTLKLEER